jgi:hypothetical protein
MMATTRWRGQARLAVNDASTFSHMTRTVRALIEVGYVALISMGFILSRPISSAKSTAVAGRG